MSGKNFVNLESLAIRGVGLTFMYDKKYYHHLISGE